MSAASAIDLARASGIALSLEGEGVRYRAPNAAPADILDRLRAHKAEVIELLRAERGELTPARIITLAEIAGYRLPLIEGQPPIVIAPTKRSLVIESVLERQGPEISAWLKYERDAVNWWNSRTRSTRPLDRPPNALG